MTRTWSVIVAMLVVLSLAACESDRSKAQAEDPPAPPSCGPGAGVDTFVFAGVSYTQDSACTTVAAGALKASSGVTSVQLYNNLFGIGSGTSLDFIFSWSGSSIGRYAGVSDLLFLQQNGTTSLCGLGAGVISITQYDPPGGRMIVSFSFAVVNFPLLCSVSSFTGSFNLTREPDQ
jgi:hypothetical protein